MRVLLGDDLGFFSGLVAWIVMVFSFRLFAGLLLVRILVVGHVILLEQDNASGRRKFLFGGAIARENAAGPARTGM
jgi:hypothetical protein